MRSKLYFYTNLTLAMIIVGSSVVFGKVITLSFPVFLASGLRFAIASALMAPILFKNRKMLGLISRKDFFSLSVMAFCGQFVFTALVLWGLRYTSAVEAGIITSTSPAMMVMASFFLFRERPTLLQGLSVALVVIGVISINGLWGKDGFSEMPDHLFGNLLMVGAVAGEAVFLLMRKQIPDSISNIVLAGCLCILGFVMFLPLSLYQALSFDFTSVGPVAWISILYFGAVFTVLAYIFWFQGVSGVSGNTAGVFTAIMPVSAVFFSCLLLREQVTVSHAVGGLMVLSAILIMTRADRRKQPTKALPEDSHRHC